MRSTLLPLCLAAAALSLAGCAVEDDGTSNQAANGASGAEQPAGDETIAAGLDENSRFYQAARAAGLDETLNGPGPYTVLVPSDAAFDGLPDGSLEELTAPESRAELTDILTYHILPGTVLVEDINRAIDNSDGTAVLATMGGATLSATRDGDRIVLTDGAGNEATITEADQRRTNGVVHYIDGVLVPGDGGDAEDSGQAGD